MERSHAVFHSLPWNKLICAVGNERLGTHLHANWCISCIT